MADTVISTLSAAIKARKNCQDKMARLNPNAVSASVPMSENEYHQAKEWFDRWTERIEQLVDMLPSGSGIDSGTKIDLDASHAGKVVLHTSFHHMNDGGMYDGWTEHTVTVTPAFRGINLRISGRDRNDIKEYLYQTYEYALTRPVVWDKTKERYVDETLEDRINQLNP